MAPATELAQLNGARGSGVDLLPATELARSSGAPARSAVTPLDYARSQRRMKQVDS